MTNEERFRQIMSYCLLGLGIFLIIHNVLKSPIGSELVFGIQFLGAAYYIAHGTFKGFGKQ